MRHESFEGNTGVKSDRNDKVRDCHPFASLKAGSGCAVKSGARRLLAMTKAAFRRNGETKKGGFETRPYDLLKVPANS